MAALAVVGGSCASIKLTSEIEETPSSERTETGVEVPAGAKLVGEVGGNLLELRLTTEATCFETDFVTMERVRHNVREMDDWDFFGWFEVGFGGLATGAGAAVVGVAPSLSNEHDVDPDTGKEDPLSDQETAYVLGSLALAAGVPVLVMAVVDSFRTVDTDDELPSREDLVDHRTYACDVAPIADVAVLGRVGAVQIELGVTDAEGHLSVDLEPLLPAHVVAAAEASPPLQVVVGAAVVGEVDLSPYVAFLENAAWAEAQTRGSVEGWQAFLAVFSNSSGAMEARAEIARLEAAARAEVEDEAWAATEAEATPEAFLEFVGSHPGSGRLADARRRAVELLLAADRIDEAENLVVAWAMAAAGVRGELGTDARREFNELGALVRTGREALAQEAADAEAAAADRVRRTLSRARSAADGCSTGGCSAANSAIAADAYRLIDSVRSQAGARQVSDAEMRVLGRCGCTR
ncbi:MAG: hypothetical protein HY905_12455 [Deltaproteobacteria bacterium]|nr:hypothetical protein [Deltaproteobacteria bacterium]